jgi:hypothetical protein
MRSAASMDCVVSRAWVHVVVVTSWLFPTVHIHCLISTVLIRQLLSTLLDQHAFIIPKIQRDLRKALILIHPIELSSTPRYFLWLQNPIPSK